MIKHKAFSLIEIMVVVAIIGMIIATTVPRILKRPSQAEWPVVVDMINDLVTLARQEAMTFQVAHRVTFAIKGEDQVIRVEGESTDPENPSRKIYRPITSLYMKTDYLLPDAIRIRGVFWGKEEQLEQNKGEAYCYVMPNGLVQSVLVHLVRFDEFEEEEDGLTLQMSTFYGQFSFREGLKKPGASL